MNVCTIDNPMPIGSEGRWQHPGAREIGEQRDGWPSGDLQSYICPFCGIQFTCELPQ